MLWAIKSFPPAFDAADFAAFFGGIQGGGGTSVSPGDGNALGWQLGQGRAQFQPCFLSGWDTGSQDLSPSAQLLLQRELQIGNDLNIPALAHL